jgi:hypothetical protein
MKLLLIIALILVSAAAHAQAVVPQPLNIELTGTQVGERIQVAAQLSNTRQAEPVSLGSSR